MSNRRRARALVLAHLLAIAAVGACAKPAAHGAVTTGSDVPNVGFDQAFTPLNSVALQLPQGEVLGVPTGLVGSGPLVVIADGAQANLKVFDRATGAFVRTIGRAGDGPGEFRSPVGIELDQNGRLPVLDNRWSVVSGRDLDGTIRDERVLIGVVTGLASVGDSDLWVTWPDSRAGGFGPPRPSRADSQSARWIAEPDPSPAADRVADSSLGTDVCQLLCLPGRRPAGRGDFPDRRVPDRHHRRARLRVHRRRHGWPFTALDRTD